MGKLSYDCAKTANGLSEMNYRELHYLATSLSDASLAMVRENQNTSLEALLTPDYFAELLLLWADEIQEITRKEKEEEEVARNA